MAELEELLKSMVETVEGIVEAFKVFNKKLDDLGKRIGTLEDKIR